MAFMASEIPTHRTLPARARSARPPHKAIAMPRAANTSAPASGIPACIAATTLTYFLVLRIAGTRMLASEHDKRSAV